MDSIIHKIDPNGDTLLVLRNPNAPFAVGDASSTWPNALPKYRTEKMRKNERELIDLANTEQSTTGNKREIYFQLSSKHLTLTSGYFCGLMANNWSETSSSLDFAYSVTAEDWNETALLIVMNIIHCQTGEIPRTVDLEMFTKVAAIVDYYQCHKAVTFYAETWTKDLNIREFSTWGYGRRLLLRLFISCVFLQYVDFRLLAWEITLESRGPIHSLGLPFPQNIIDAIENERKKFISGIISGLETLVGELIAGSGACSFECCSMSLGALIKGMKGMKLLEPNPASTFEGYSFVAMERALCNIKQPDYRIISHSAPKSDPLFTKGRLPTHTCYLSERLTPIINVQEHKIKGLVLNEYIDTNRET